MSRPSQLRAFLDHEAASGVVLLLATVAALTVANSPLAAGYHTVLAVPLGPLALHQWIDDGLMALFFMLVGLEMKRELVAGHLSRWSDRALPAVAALGGMAVPALVYLAIAGQVPGLARGWAIPAATDIAFAVGVLALVRGRIAAGLAPFLTAVAVIDDMGAIVIIASVYTEGLRLLPLAVAAGLWAGMLWMGRRGVGRLPAYLAGAAGLWAAVFASGIHPTVAGVLAAFAVPIHHQRSRSPLHRLEHALHPWVAFGIMPLFAFANAGLSLDGLSPAALASPLPLAVALGLFLGKQAGLFGAVRLMVAAGLAERPAGSSWLQLYGIALLCGIGFTMSLFIGGLAFADQGQRDAVRLGVLAGSLAAACAGFLVLRLSPPAGRP